MNTRRVLPALTLVLCTLGCGAGSSEPPDPTNAQSTQQLPLSHLGRWLGSVPIESTRLDRVDWAPMHQGAVAVVHHGRDGGSSLYSVDGNARHELLYTQQAQVVSPPVVDDSGTRYALVVEQSPRWVGQPGRSALQYGGQLWLGDESGNPHRVSDLDDAARVLGWLDKDTLVFTRYLPGDLPEQRPFRMDLNTGHVVRIATPVDSHAYNFALFRSQLLYSETDAPVMTLPSPATQVSVIALDLVDGERSVLATERGAMPTSFAWDGSKHELHYGIDGTSLHRAIDVQTGRATTEAVRIPPPPNPTPRAGMLMPYVHQVYDTPNDFNGHWACGPTSTLMAILHFGRLDPWPETVDVPSPHESLYGAYVSRTYTAYGTTFDRVQSDASGSPAHGAYGWCTEDGAAWAWRMQDYAESHELQTEFDDAATFAEIEAATAAGKVVALSTQLTSAGHIITVKGTNPAGELIVNDPYGNRNSGYMNYEGEDVTYTFAEVSAKWFITVYASGPSYAATLIDSQVPEQVTAGETAEVSLTYRNDGNVPWDTSTLLGTTEPRDRESIFHTDGDWISATRPVGVSEAVYPGASAALTFTLTPPEVCEPTTYVEHFNLVQEGILWFADDGGPSDDTVALSIEVLPAPGACADAGVGGQAGAGGTGATGGSGGSAGSGGSLLDAGATGGGTSSQSTYRSEEADGCACRASGRPTRFAWGWFAVGALGLFISRRRAQAPLRTRRRRPTP